MFGSRCIMRLRAEPEREMDFHGNYSPQCIHECSSGESKSCKMELQDVDMHVSYWLAENVSSRAPTPLPRTSNLALLPMTATGSGSPSPRIPPSER